MMRKRTGQWIAAFFSFAALVSYSNVSEPFWHGGGGGPTCGITKNINTDFGAVGSGLVDETPRYVGTGSFLDFAVNTYQPANPDKTICLTQVAGNRYFFGVFAQALFENIKSLIVNGNGAISTNALDLTTTAPTAAGSAILTFASVPSGVVNGMSVLDVANRNLLCDFVVNTCFTILSKTATTVTLSSNVPAPGIALGDTISFKNVGFFFGSAGAGPDPSGVNHLPIQTVSAGATSVTLVTPADASKLTVGTWTPVTGIDLQGGGQPVNQWFHEYKKIIAINAGTGVITFDSPLIFGYKTAWPADQGGPGAIWVIPTTWDVNQTYNNVTIFGWDGPGNTNTNANGRAITFTGASFPSFGPNISFMQTFVCNSCSVPATRTEIDKLFESATLNGGTWAGLQFFSGTANDVVTLNGVHVTQAVIGTPGVFNINNSTFDAGMKAGALANGITTSISCSNSNLGPPGIYDWGGVNDQTITAANGVTLNTSGLMTIPRTATIPIRWAVPGAEVFLGNVDTFWGLPFSVTDVTGDVTNTYVQTTLTGFSSLPGSAVTAALAKTINFVNCTGSPSVLDWSQAGAQNARPGTFSNRIYTCTNGIAAQQALHPGVPVIDLNNAPTTDPRMTRALMSLTIAVSQAEAGAAVNWQGGGQFNNGKIFNSSNVGSTWAWIVNLNVAGTRSYNGTTNTWSGSQTGDTLPTTTPGFPSYIGGTFAFAPFITRSVSAETAGTCPIVTLTVQTSFLLRRDFDPAANDNAPAFMDMAA